MEYVKIIAAIGIFVLMGYIVLSPNVVYAPVPRLMLYFLSSSAIAVFLGAEAATRFQLKAPGMLFIAGGTVATMFLLLWFGTNYVKPEQQVAVYQIVDESGFDVRIDWGDEAVKLSPTPNGLTATLVVSGNTMVLIFPEQVTEQDIRVLKTSDGHPYSGKVTYTGSRRSILTLGSELKLRSIP